MQQKLFQDILVLIEVSMEIRKLATNGTIGSRGNAGSTGLSDEIP